MKTIHSTANPEIKKVTALHQAKYRKQSGLFVAEGLNTVSELMHAGIQLTALYATEQRASEIKYRNTIIVSENVMEKLSSTKNPSGIVGVFAIPKSTNKLSYPGLVLAQISDPGNMGTLIRTAAAMKVKDVVIVEGTDPWSPKVIQSTAGTIGLVNIHQLSWDELQKHDLTLCALVVNNGKAPDTIDLQKTFLVVGSEAHGLPKEWLAECAEKLTLPMPGKTESLNAAVAGSIALYVMRN